MVTVMKGVGLCLLPYLEIGKGQVIQGISRFCLILVFHFIRASEETDGLLQPWNGTVIPHVIGHLQENISTITKVESTGRERK